MTESISLTLTGPANRIAAALAAFNGSTATAGIAPPSPLPMSVPTPNPDDGEDDGTPGAPGPVGGLDSTGMPWDGRIHSANKTTTAAGAWRKVKAVDKTLVVAVEAELRRATAPAGDPAVMQPAPMPPMPPVQPVPMPTMAPPVPMPPVQPVPMPTMAPPVPMPVAPVDPATLDFHGFMQHMSGLMQTKRDPTGVPLITIDYMTNLAKRISEAYQMPTPLTSITDLMQHPDKIAYAVQLVQHDGLWV